MEDEAFLSNALEYSKKSFRDTALSCFPCYKKPRKEYKNYDGEERSLRGSDDTENQRNRLRSLELQIQQTEQKCAALVVAKNRTEQQVAKEKQLKQQAEEAIILEKRNSSQVAQSSANVPENQKEIERLTQEIQKVEAKVARQEKFNNDIETQLKNIKPASAPDLQISQIKRNIEAERASVVMLKKELIQMEGKQSVDGGSGQSDAELDGKIREAELKIKDLKDEIAFRDNMASNNSNSQSGSANPSPAPSPVSGGAPMRGRVGGRVGITQRVNALNNNAPSAPEGDNNNNNQGGSSASPSGSSPPVPSRNSSLADRMKAFQNS